MWFDGKNKEQEKKQKTAVAQSVSLKRQKKMMYRFIRIIS